MNSSLIKNEGHILKAKTKGCISSVLKAECYVLEDGTPIIRGRGYVRSLIGAEKNHNQSGQRFSRMINNDDIRHSIFERNFCIILFKIASTNRFECTISAFHLSNSPLESIECLIW